MQQTQPTMAAIMAEVEDTWKKFNNVYQGFTIDQWAKKYGKDWIFSDQPYHMVFFDKAMVVDAIAKGGNPSDKWLLKSVPEINAWNGREFAKRPADQTAVKSLEQYKASQESIRQMVKGLKESDASRPSWIPLMMGQATVRDALMFCLVHNVGEYTELRLRLGGKPPPPTPESVHFRLAAMMAFMGMLANPEEAKKTRMTVIWNFTGPGGGAWTFNIGDGKCVVTDGKAQKPDLMITTTLEGFEKMMRKMQNPMLMMLTRQVKVKGMRKMGVFQKLFPMG